MYLTKNKKTTFINAITTKLSQFSEIDSVVLFGSFLSSQNPNDIDIAVIQDSNENFLTLSLKYRKVLREISKIIPIDIIPIKEDAKGLFLDEIYKGKIVYEK
ncbi:nucleotidyltransferase domain-containing protein [Sulfurimonas sediminis]|uniref:Nucleotidyltransferase domain-containing protein n=1 Tax=Sulfurimonas sediminis TaxID=2590020 RepID=A0A7M1AYX7_9BACT|nr:nucleotidyltransferase domain-containing protein [Sulfurimonas sediminis]QOP42506.1 nucleotidyltransferase domain-containing protein [Sulfurimonas sediminis]